MLTVKLVTLIVFIYNISKFGYCFKIDTNSVLNDELTIQINIDPDFGLDIYHLSKKYNYSLETHWVETEDGYVLRMHRIPFGKNETYPSNKNKVAVLLMHGVTGSSMHWTTLGPNQSLAFQLADQGFDVWLGNNRGNTYSRQHVSLDPDLDPEFWDFSYEKCGQYDLPAKIDYVIKHTGQQKILFVAHSQGTTEFLAMAALRPEYNKKIALFAGLAPVVYVQNLTSPLFMYLGKNLELLEAILDYFNIHEVLNYDRNMAMIHGYLCADGSPFQDMCSIFIFLIGGYDVPQLDKNRLSVFLSEAPDGMSKNMFFHYEQNMKSGNFQRYDYGPDLNTKYYGTPIPPLFNTSAITAPVAIYYAKNDFLVPIDGVKKLVKELPNIVKLKLIKYELFSHMDYILAKDINELLYEELIEDLKKYSPN